MIYKHIVTSLVIIIFFPFLNISAAGWGDVSQREWNQTAPEDYLDANAVKLFDSLYVGVLREDAISYYVEKVRHVRIKILNKEGIDEASDVEFSYHKRTRVINLKAHTIKPDGTILEVNKENFLEKKVNDFRFTSFAFSSVEVGDILEYTYTLYSAGIMGYYKWYFHSNLYTIKSIFSLEVIPGFEYTFATSNIAEEFITPAKKKNTRVQTGVTTTYTWKIKDLKPLKAEPFMGAINDYNANLIIQIMCMKSAGYRIDGFNDWKSYGEAFQRGIRGYTKKPRGFGKLIKDITSGLKTKYDKSKAIYNYVIDNIQTRQEDYGLGFKHESMDKLVKESHGSAIEKNILMIEMFKKARIKAWPILISTRDHGKIDPTVFREDQFNHLIIFAEVEEGGIYLDATSKYCPYGILAPQCRADIGLIIDDDKSELMRIITSQPKSIRVDLSKIHVDENGQAVCSLQSRFSGYMSIEIGRKYEVANQDMFIQNDFLGDLPQSYAIDSFSCSLNENNYFTIDAVLTFSDLLERFGENLSFPLLSYLFADNPFEAEERKFPINFNYPFTYHNITHVSIDEDINTFSLPEEKHFSADGLNYIRKAHRTEFGFSVEFKLEITKPLFSVEEYPVLKEFFKRVSTCAKEQIIMKISQEG